MSLLRKRPSQRSGSSPGKVSGTGAARNPLVGGSNLGMAAALRASSANMQGGKGIRVSHPGDSIEAQADRIASAALDGANRPVQAAPAAHHAANPGLLPPGSGEALPQSVRNEFEPRFGTDFAGVRIHRGQAAAAAAAGFEAHAYTVGQDVVLGRDDVALDSYRGSKLIAHELAHVAQGGPGAGNEVRRLAWTPTHADERTSTGADRFASQTFELAIPALTGESGHTSTQNIAVSIFVPSGAVPDRNKVHIFFSPGGATQTGLRPDEVGLNAAMTHGFRGASDRTEWILISVPGRGGGRHGEANAFNTIDTAGVQACLRAAGRTTTAIDALRFSSHSRGSRGLRETLNRHLIPAPVAERVVVFDAAFSSLDRALAHSAIPGSRMVALNVIDSGRLTVAGARNIQLGAGAMRAIGYSRIIQDARSTMPTLSIPPAISAQLLALPARGLFTTASPAPAGMTNINDFARTHAKAIQTILLQENNPVTGMKPFIDNNNLIRLGVGNLFSSSIYSHHLFVAELAHEVVD